MISHGHVYGVAIIFFYSAYALRPYYTIDRFMQLGSDQVVEVPHWRITKVADQIMDDLTKNPLKEWEQLNISGFSYGSVLVAQASINLLREGKIKKIDNLILIGSPVNMESELYKELQKYVEEGKIGKIIYTYVEGDKVVGAASKPLNEKVEIWEETESDGMWGNEDNKHIMFGGDSERSDNIRQKVSENIKKAGVE